MLSSQPDSRRTEGRRVSDFKRYYEDELGFLRELGAEFAAAYPDIARELKLGGRDPDVERLLQGVAFLTGRIRQNLDAQFPELLHPLLAHLFPAALRPSPCAAMLEFLPRPNMLREPHVLKAGAQVKSAPVDGTACTFRVVYDTPILPLAVESVRQSAQGASAQRLHVTLKAMPGAQLARLGKHPLRLYLHGANVQGMGREAFGLYAWLSHYLRGVRLRILDGSGQVLGERALGRDALQPVGWKVEESLLPYPRYAFAGYRHLVEYFLFPPKFLFMDLHGLGALGELPPGERVELVFDLAPLPGEELVLSTEHVRLNCVPAVNLFPHTATPLTVDGTRAEHPLRPEGSAPGHYDIFSVDKVMGHWKRNPRPTEYHPFFSFYRPPAEVGETPVMYQVHWRAPVAERVVGREDLPAYPAGQVLLSFVEPSGEPLPLDSIVSVDLLCTNRDLPLRLRPGEISRPTTDIPSSLQVRDLGALSTPAPAPVGGDGLWRFFAYLSVSLNHFRDRDSLRVLLQLYNFPARYHLAARQKLETLLESVAEVAAQPADRMVGRPPTLLRGTEVRLTVHETRFAHFGELALFGSAMDRFLAETATVNSFTRLILRGIDQGLELPFPARVGTQGLV